MKFLPSPLVAPPPSNRAFGRKLARLIATMRKRKREFEAAHQAPKPLPTNTSKQLEIP